jgi:anti-sigma factor RsiW
MTNCEEVRPLLGAYADAQLGPLESDAVVVHLEQCGRCRQIVRDQQQVQHVLDSWQPPAVSNQAWAEMGKRLRTELEGKAAPQVLKTRSHTDALESTPASTPTLRLDEARRTPSRNTDLARPEPRRWSAKPTPAPAAAPVISVVRVRPKRPAPRFTWVAHLAGAAAAVLVLFFALTSNWTETAKPPATPLPVTFSGPIALAQPGDVTILDVQTLDPDYNVVVDTGDASEAATVWVVLSREEG